MARGTLKSDLRNKGNYIDEAYKTRAKDEALRSQDKDELAERGRRADEVAARKAGATPKADAARLKEYNRMSGDYKGFRNPGIPGFNKFINLIQSNDAAIQRADRNDAVAALRRNMREDTDLYGLTERNWKATSAVEFMQDWLKNQGHL
jgi:hypothetical protein